MVVWYFFLYENHNTYLFVSFHIRNNLTNVHVSPCPRGKLLFISNYKLSSNWHLNKRSENQRGSNFTMKWWQDLEAVRWDKWLINKTLYQRAKENHIQWRECNTASYQRSKPSKVAFIIMDLWKLDPFSSQLTRAILLHLPVYKNNQN